MYEYPFPHVVNMFDTEQDACSAALRWSRQGKEEWAVIHGPSEKGLVFYAERGDGGMIRNTERLVAQYENGRKVVA